MLDYKDIQTKKLKDLAEVFSGFAFKSEDLDSHQGIPVLKIANIQDKKVIKEIVSYFPFEKYSEKLSRFIYQEDDVLVAMTGEGSVGKFGKMRNLDKKYLVNQRVGIIRPNRNSVVPEYLFQVLTLPQYEEVLYQLGLGAGQPNVSPKDIGNLYIPYVDPEKQEAIASILSAYNELIETNSQRMKLLELTASELYKEWFVRMRFPGYRNAKFKKGMPEGWVSERFEQHITIVRGKSYTSEEIDDVKGTHAFINLKNINRGGGFRLDGTKFYSGKFKQEQLVKPGDIVMAVTDMTQERSVVGRVARVPLTNFNEYVISLDTAKIVSISLPCDYIYSALRFNYYGESLAEYANGTNVLHLNPELLKKEFLIVPEKKIIISYVHQVKPMFELIDYLQIQNTQLRQIRDRLLPRLISGKLQVKVDEKVVKVIPISQDTISVAAQAGLEYNSNVFFTRRVLAAYIIDRLYQEITFGHVKLMKLMYLCEHLAEIETASHYHRDAAGPYDNNMIRSIDSQLKKAKWFAAKLENGKYNYYPLANKDEYKPWFDKYFFEKQAGIDSLINLFGKEKTEKVEMVATLYEAHRDLKSKRTILTEKEVIHEVLNNWHESKKRIDEGRWKECFAWMQQKNWINMN